MNSKNLIITFTRNPELGKCKTRLAKTVGDEAALRVYKYLLQHTEKVIKQVDADKAVYYSDNIKENDFWEASVFQKHQQVGQDLGERMQKAFENGFMNGYEKIVIVGSDLFHLQPTHINEAFHGLDANDVVIGPAEDGGYYLLGMKTLHASVFKNKNWGTETVFKDTVANLKQNKIQLLETLNDIDLYEDLEYIEPLQNIINNND
ncbi:TIGR04282 family arsenosugar biosynthesis glycosyltransferase [Lacinutrix neustonica]|uniref:TIGR04282 family arsenosugar biosynthesis glycosyltransferase n=1 Tax=Lacinutrix neustonica TaxID=2980107 RepID=A0A9E8SDP0_9FLAO|nr:TIGR04282 family arsenosugar biosynthesis glycosyltransferase [Lacinutrix neustonica]WAC01414.1 TIGR04282 family arsenosugar biosynthesis glycosyltransferase [Lacinutrix neustonica]